MLKLSIVFKWENLLKKVLYLWKCNIFLSTMYWNIFSIFFSFFSNFGNPLLTFIVLHYNSMLFESGFVLLWHWKVYLTLKSVKGRKKAQTNIDILEWYELGFLKKKLELVHWLGSLALISNKWWLPWWKNIYFWNPT